MIPTTPDEGLNTVPAESPSGDSTNAHPQSNELKKNRKPIKVETRRSSAFSPSRPAFPIDVHIPGSSSNRMKPATPSLWSVSTLTQSSVDDIPTTSAQTISGFSSNLLLDKEKMTARANFVEKNKHRNILSKIFSTSDGRKRVCLHTLLGLVLGALIGLVAYFLTHKEEGVCYSQECQDASTLFLSAMNRSANPCEDFYSYTCGSFEEAKDSDDQPLPYLETLQFINQKILQDALEGPYQKHASGEESTASLDARIFEKVTGFYKTCQDETRINATGLGTAKQYFKTFYDTNLPLPSSSFGNALSKALAQSHLYSADALFKPVLSHDRGVAGRSVLVLSQGGWSLSKKQFASEEVASNFTLTLAQVLPLLTPLSPATASQVAKDIFALEYRLANSSVKETESVTHTPNITLLTVKELKQMIPIIDWDSYLSNLIPAGPLPGFDDGSVIVTKSPSYFRELGNILSNTSSITLDAYLLWSQIRNLLPSLPSTSELQRIKELTDNTYKDRKSFCFSITQLFFQDYSTYLFVHRAFGPKQLEKAKSLLADIKSQLRKQLQRVDWLDSKTRVEAISKLDAMVSKIGFPKDTMSLDYQARRISRFDYDPRNFTASVLSVLYSTTYQAFESLRKPFDIEEWGISPLLLNAYYAPLNNEMVLPVSILRAPIFWYSLPDYMNYGALGSIMGHEMTHGFDSTGSQYDKSGRFVNWWTTDTRAKFDEKSQCLVDQYGLYSVGNLAVNGKATLRENMADNGGVFQAYDAWIAKNISINNARLPGLQKYTPEQMFFLSYGRLWCKSSFPILDMFQSITDTHSLNRFRVNGPLANHPAFATAFQCPIGSPMNPAKKCRVW